MNFQLAFLRKVYFMNCKEERGRVGRGTENELLDLQSG